MRSLEEFCIARYWHYDRSGNYSSLKSLDRCWRQWYRRFDPILDTRITHHSDGSLSTRVFRKSTHTNRYLDFKSHHSLAHKVAVAQTLLNRAERISTKPPGDREGPFCKEIENNGYPRGLVLKHWTPTKQPPPEQDTPTATATLPYIRTYATCQRGVRGSWLLSGFGLASSHTEPSGRHWPGYRTKHPYNN